MKPDYTDIILLVDNSEKTTEFKTEIENGVNYFVKSLKKCPNKVTYTHIEYDDFPKYNAVGVPVRDLGPDFYMGQKKPKGNRALLDTLGKVIKSTGERLAKLKEEERPSNVVVAIYAAGSGNCSAYYNAKEVKEMIGHQTGKYSWRFIYIGTDPIDAVRVGIKPTDTLEVTSNTHGVNAAFNSLVNRFADGSYKNKEFFKNIDRSIQMAARGVFSN